MRGYPRVLRRDGDMKLLPPTEMLSYLNRFVIGQDNAKRALINAAYISGLELLTQAGVIENFGTLPKQAVALIGNTGTGKSHLVRTLVRMLVRPFSFHSATDLVQTGYVGTNIESMMTQAFGRAGYDLAKARRLILHIDEFDKVRCHHDSSGPDVNGEGVQNALLTLLDGRPVSVRRDGSRESAHIDLQTEGMLFIFTGAFSGLSNIVERRLGRHRRFTGFVHHRPISSGTQLNWSEHLQTEDLIEFGLIPELAGRLTQVVVLDPLSIADLEKILISAEDSCLHRYRNLFAMHGIMLKVTPDAVRAIAERAFYLHTGARSLDRIVSRVLEQEVFRLGEYAIHRVDKLIITAETIQTGAAQAFRAGSAFRHKSSATESKVVRQ
ncbi:MAG: AAA family ATPase [Blastocatellia bacterium]